MAELNNLQWEMFCKEYIIDFDKRRAALSAGYCKNSKNDASIYAIALELYNRDEIRNRIRELLTDRRKEYDITTERTIQEMSRVAFADITEIIDSFSNAGVVYKSLADIPRRIRPAIKSISTTQFGIKVDFHDKIQAIEQLAKYLGIYEKDNEQKKIASPQIYLPHNGRNDAPTSDKSVEDGTQPSPWQA